MNEHSLKPLKIVILGHTGGIGSALAQQLTQEGHQVIGLSRSSDPSFDLSDETRIRHCAEHAGPDIDWLINATGVLADNQHTPERTLKQLDSKWMQQQFLVNAIGPMLVIKHFLPFMRAHSPSVMACFSARVSSISDNRLGGWYSYRASKSALNQLIKTASIEMKRTQPLFRCVALHPGTVDTPLSSRFVRGTHAVFTREDAALKLVHVLKNLTPEHSGLLIDYNGITIPW